jgi:hypothetical protein
MALPSESVSSVIRRVSPFDANGRANSSSSMMGLSADDYLGIWSQMGEGGTAMHEAIESMVDRYGVTPRSVTKKWKEARATEAQEQCSYFVRDWYRTGLNIVHMWLKKLKNLEVIQCEMETCAEFELEHPVTHEVVVKSFRGRCDGVFKFTQSYRGVDTERYLIADWKTARNVTHHATYLFQVCLYALLFSERTPGVEYEDMRVCIVYTSDIEGVTKYYKAIQSPSRLKSRRMMCKYLVGVFDDKGFTKSKDQKAAETKRRNR